MRRVHVGTLRGTKPGKAQDSNTRSDQNNQDHRQVNNTRGYFL